MLDGFFALLPLKLFRSLSFSHSLFAAYAVIANGQVECPKGFKRMNLTHCQGKLQHMFKNVSAGIGKNNHFMYFFFVFLWMTSSQKQNFYVIQAQ